MTTKNINLNVYPSSIDAIIGLVQDHGMSNEEAKAYYKANKPQASRGHAASLYAELEKGPMTDDEMDAWMDTRNSTNVKKHRSTYCGIVRLANSIHAKYNKS